MKKIIVAAATVVIAVGAFFPKAHAVLPTGREIVLIICYNGNGDVTGVGNTCDDGTGSCVPNFCKSSS